MASAARASPGSARLIFGEIGLVTAFAVRAARSVFRPPFEWAETVRQIYLTGWRSLPLIITSGFAPFSRASVIPNTLKYSRSDGK